MLMNVLLTLISFPFILDKNYLKKKRVFTSRCTVGPSELRVPGKSFQRKTPITA